MRVFIAASFATLALATANAASDHGTPEEALAMLQRAVEAIRVDEPAALVAIHEHDPRFKVGELYVVCGGEDGKLTAHGLKGYEVGLISMRDFADRGGRPVGQMIYNDAAEGEIHTVEYPKPGQTRPSTKVSDYTKVADQICVVGYYT